jgi:hypothetical protein
MRYGKSKIIVNSLLSQDEYFENLTDTRISYGDFLLGFRLLNDAPPEIGVEFSGIRKRFIEFTRSDLSVRAGDSYSLYGRGLALNLFENRALGFDTGLDGVKFLYQSRLLKATATGGKVFYRDVLAPTRVEEYRLRAGSVELAPYPFLSIGTAFASGLVFLSNASGRFDMPDYFVRAHVGEFDAFVSYAEKRSSVFPTFVDPDGERHKGTGFYSSVAFAHESFGLTLEFKDYRFGNADPNDRSNPDRVTKALIIQNPPIVHKEHSFTLASRYPHVVDFGDEVGFQIDAYFTAGQLTGNLNFSAASRHYAYSATGDTDRTTMLPIFQGEKKPGSILPSFSDRFSPFQEIYGDVQYYFEEDGTDYLELAFNKRTEKFPLEATRQAGEPLRVEARDIIGVPTAIQYTLGDGFAVKLLAERQWIRDDTNIESSRFFNQYFAVSISLSPGIALSIRHEFTSDKETIDGREDWSAIDLAFWISTSHTIMLMAGAERGGLVCTNNVCRTVPPFRGFRASITSYL